VARTPSSDRRRHPLRTGFLSFPVPSDAAVRPQNLTAAFLIPGELPAPPPTADISGPDGTVLLVPDGSFPTLSGRGRGRSRIVSSARGAHQFFLTADDLPPDELRSRFDVLRTRVRAAGDLGFADLPEALGLAACAVRMVTGISAYPVQFLGAAVVAAGSIAEMPTGEGKTITTQLAAVALALTGRPVHVATANEYLADRDAESLRAVAELLGFTVGLSRVGSSTAERIAAHAADVVYGTAVSFGFDYLYDNLAISEAEIAGREPYAAIVDEADAVLLDEARSPLLISGRGTAPDRDAERFAALVKSLTLDDVYIDPARSFVVLNERGVARTEALLGVEDLYADPLLVQCVSTALSAGFLLRSGVDYLVVEGPTPEVVLIDANTGRRRERSRLRAGVHEALEAKEGLRIRAGGVTKASVAVQTFFSRYQRLGGLTGTALSSAAEFDELYGLKVFQVPPNRPRVREDLADRIFATAAARDAALDADVETLLLAGRPVLLLTDSVEDAERLSDLLTRFSPRLLSARNPEVEADVISRAGEPGALTVATAMAGRGVDVLLGGNPADPGYAGRREFVLATGGLAVLSVVRFPSRRVDDQLRGRAGRQGEPGSSCFYLSFEDELPRRYAPDTLAGLLGSSGELPPRLAAPVFRRAQSAVEEDDRAARRATLVADLPLARHRDLFYAYRLDLLRLTPWERAHAVVHAGLLRRLPETIASVEEAHRTLGRFWPALVDFPSFETPISAEEITPRLTKWFLDRLAERLHQLGDLTDAERHEVLVRLVGSMVLDALDRSWASHLERATSLHVDTSMVSRTGQKPERIYRSLLEESFEGVFARFEYVATANLGGLRLDSLHRGPVAAG
jgi:preprotein translocase subunit SecA